MWGTKSFALCPFSGESGPSQIVFRSCFDEWTDWVSACPLLGGKRTCLLTTQSGQSSRQPVLCEIPSLPGDRADAVTISRSRGHHGSGLSCGIQRTCRRLPAVTTDWQWKSRTHRLACADRSRSSHGRALDDLPLSVGRASRFNQRHRYDWNQKSTTLSYRRLQNRPKCARNGTNETAAENIR